MNRILKLSFIQIDRQTEREWYELCKFRQSSTIQIGKSASLCASARIPSEVTKRILVLFLTGTQFPEVTFLSVISARQIYFWTEKWFDLHTRTYVRHLECIPRTYIISFPTSSPGVSICLHKTKKLMNTLHILRSYKHAAIRQTELLE